MNNLPNNNDEANNDDVNNKGPWLSGKKRPNKGRSHTHGRSIHLNEHTGIKKPIIPQKYAVIIEDEEEQEKDEEDEEAGDMFSSEIRGNVGTGIQYSRMVSRSKITPWKKQVIGPADARQPSYSRRLSHSRPLRRDGGRRTHKHKRKNKHTRRRVQRRRVRA